MSIAADIIMSTPNFRFKQFTIWHDKCAMKVGTDGVLLGAWCPKGTRILDVGTGSGLIARMLMQRCPDAEIEGIDIDEAAVEQARENGVRAFQARLQDWQNDKSQNTNYKYDLVVSNPPYFQNSLKNPDKGRQTARHTDTMPFVELIRHSARLLKEDGQLALILPAEAEAEVRQLAAAENLFLAHVTRVYSKENKKAKRVLLAFQLKIGDFRFDILEDSLVLEDENGGRSEAYRQLTKDFYL